MITSVPAFIDYFEGVRRRTRDFFGAIRPSASTGRRSAGEYSCGDIVRHVAATEAMFVGRRGRRRWHYPGHERDGRRRRWPPALARLDAGHARADRASCAGWPTARSRRVRARRWSRAPARCEPGGLLLAMVGARGAPPQSSSRSYLTWMGLEAPDIFGLGWRT